MKPMNCPKCGEKMDCEDSMADTGKGWIGGIIYWCDSCKYQCDEEGNEEEFEEVK